MIYLEAPKDFNPKFDVVSCFLEKGDEFLLLLRQDYKPQGNTWGVPAGKIEASELPIEAIQREIEEEVGCVINREALTQSHKVYVRYPDYDFVYYIFKSRFAGTPHVSIDPETHKDFRWLTPREALKMDLIPDLDSCIKLTYMLDNSQTIKQSLL